MASLAFLPKPVAELPWRMLILVIGIAAFSTLVLYSAADGHMYWALPQAMRFAVFFAMAIAMSWLRPAWIKQAAFPAYVIILFMLLFVEALGFVGGGAQRWLNLGFINLQPSELMKPVIVLATAHFYALLPAREIRGWSALWPAGLLIGIPAALILIQPDLGTATMVVLGGVTIMFLAGVPLRLFAGAVAAAAVILPIALSFLHDYQRQRVLIFLNPEADPLHSGYHITQSKIAIGSGGLVGNGFLQGTQSRFSFLPEKHTDFIFATMAEEWGLLGGLFLIASFALILHWGMRVASESRDRFSRLAAAGLTTTIFFYVAINLMMVMGLAPVVGIPLPLFSYGGSAMMTVMICLGLLMAIERQNRRDARKA
ncbi:MAG: rod shape determining protein RodA [Sphingomonadales bacterium]|jgi:rod shape determining protein RodA|nr:rod shape determining protein RodA [Sphingomonadales bacterium]